MPILSSGQLRKVVPQRDSLRVPRRSLSLPDGRQMAYAELWRAQPAVRTVVNFLAHHVAQMGMRAYAETGEGRSALNQSHPLRQWTVRPSPTAGSVAYWGRVVADVCIFDAHLSILHRSSDGRLWTQPVPRRLWEAKGETWLGAETFLVGGRGGREFKPHEVVHIAGYDPDSIGVGCSPMEALRQTLAADFEAERNRVRFWRSGARPTATIERPVDAPPWSEEARDRFLAEWDEAFSAGGVRDGATAILEDGMTLKPFSVSARDSQYLESRKLSREEAAAAYLVAPPLIGILDHATYSNISEQHKALYSDTLGWWFRRLEQVFLLQLAVPHFGDDVTLSFDEWERLRGSAAEQASTMSTAVGGPYMTRNEARERVGMAPVDGGDELIVPLNVVVGGQSAPSQPLEVPTGKAGGQVRLKAERPTVGAGRSVADEMAALLTSHFERQKASTMSRLGPSKAVTELAFDVERFTTEMADDMTPILTAAVTSAAEEHDAVVSPALAAWAGERSTEWARIVNDVTSSRVGDALTAGDSVPDVFADRVAESTDLARSIDSDTRHATVERVAAKSVKKRWRTTSAQPRPSHASQDGDIVPLADRFANGQRWPGERTGSHQDFGCVCTLEYLREETL